MPPGAVPGRIALVADTQSPYWNSLIQKYVPARFNYFAGYKIIDGSPDAPFKLKVWILNADKQVSGFTAPDFIFGTSVRTKTKVEIKAVLLDQNNNEVTSWAYWDEDSSEDTSINALATSMAKAFRNAGFLAPSFYTSRMPAQAAPRPADGAAAGAKADARTDAQQVEGFRRKALQGDAEAQFNLGCAYRMGIGVLQDYEEAVKWYRLAAAQRFSAAEFKLGLSYRLGQGVPQDNVRAYAWSNVASAHGDKQAPELRTDCMKTMTPAQVAEGQRLSRELAQDPGK